MLMSEKRPNFIIFMTDQQRADHLGCYGNSLVETPNIDGMANRGVRFDRFYVSNPVCQPNRACLATGQLSSVNGARHNGIAMSLNSVTYADVLRSSGYKTGLIGKAHFQNVSPIPPPPRETTGEGVEPDENMRRARRDQRSGDAYKCEIRRLWAENPGRELPVPYYGFDHVRLCIGHGDQVEGHYTGWLRGKLDGKPDPRGPQNALDNEADHDPQVWATAVPEELYPTRYVEEEAICFLNQTDGETPFLLVVSFPDPHHPFTPPGRYRAMYDPSDVEIPESFNSPVYERNDITSNIRAAYKIGRDNPHAYWPFHPTEEHLRKMIALNYGSISFIDDAIGNILTKLDEIGATQDTVLCFMSDHGDYMGDHGTVLKQGLHYNSIIRVPFIWSDPRAVNGHTATNLQGSAIDFAPTILQRAGLKVPIGMQGIDLFAEDTENRPVLIEDQGTQIYLHGDAQSATLSLVHNSWRISIFEGEDIGELFDLDNDPNEMSNLWVEPNAAAKKSDMLHLLALQQLKLRDRSLCATAQA
jgi:arylsulfatase A-like enzyme